MTVSFCLASAIGMALKCHHSEGSTNQPTGLQATSINRNIENQILFISINYCLNFLANLQFYSETPKNDILQSALCTMFCTHKTANVNRFVDT